MSNAPKRRIYELDLLRGFFICIIILDHLQFWPSPWQYMTGQGRLWASAAEGFFLISGLLVGYLRAYKAARLPLGEVSIGLLKRAGLLYVWGVLITFVVLAISALLPGDGGLLPKFPEAHFISSFGVYLWSVFSTMLSSDWIYFLRLYAIMLALTPLFLWLIRKGWWWIAAGLSAGIYTTSLITGWNEAAMQWQVLFFGAALIGWKFEAIMAWLRKHLFVRRAVIASLITVTLSTMALSYFMVHGWDYVEAPGTTLSRESYVSVRSNLDPLFANDPLVPLRVALSFVWFGGLLALFHVSRRWLMKYLSWLLLPFGQASLTAYCLQAIVLLFVVTFVPFTNNFWLNGLVGALVLLLFAGLIRLPFVQRVLPR